MKKKFENFLKQLGDSPEKKRNISSNSFYPSYLKNCLKFNGLFITSIYLFIPNITIVDFSFTRNKPLPAARKGRG